MPKGRAAEVVDAALEALAASFPKADEERGGMGRARNCMKLKLIPFI